MKYTVGAMVNGFKLIERWEEKSTKGNSRYYGQFECKYCGGWFESLLTRVGTGRIKSCGCQNIPIKRVKQPTHGLSNHKVRKIWGGIKSRCLNTKSKNYKYYGGRGIQLYPLWRISFKAFFNYTTNLPSYPGEENIGKGEDKLTLDRINNDGNYEPGNLRWASHIVQMNNTRKNGR